ncbi:putative ribonuclease H-like domain-containing protein, partial [Tanacetum coccineum]
NYKSSNDKAEDDTVDDNACKTVQEPANAVRKEFEAQSDSQLLQEKITRASSTNSFNTVSTPVNTASASRTFSPPNDPLMPELEDTAEMQRTSIFCNAYDDHDLETLNTPYADQSVGAEANFNNMEPSTIVSLIPITRIHSILPKAQIIGDPKSVVQTRGKIKKSSREHAMISYIQKKRRTNHKDFQNCLFACFLSQHETTKITQDLDDESWVETMQEELLQFKFQKVWTLVDLPYGKKAIGTKWVYVNKKDERGIVVKNKARLIDVKSAFPYGTIEKEVYVCQPPGFVDLKFPDKVSKVEKALYGLHQAPRAWYETLSTYLLDNGFHRGQIDKTLFIKRLKGDILLVQVYIDDIIFGSTKKSLCNEFEQIMHNRFQMSSMGELTFFLGLQVKQKEDGIFISQDKYVGEILKKFGFFSIKSASTPTETHKALTKDEDGEDVDVHLYKSMIGSLMYLTSSRPDIMFSVCACSRFQVQPKVSHLNAVKRIFRYLKGQPKLGLWYPKDSPLILEAFSDSDYAGASLDRKSTTRVLWIQNQMLNYGYNFMLTKIHVDNKSAICVIKNLVYHSKIKHIEIRHHFIRDSYEKRLIEMVKIHTDYNVADLLTKAFDVSRFNFLVASIGKRGRDTKIPQSGSPPIKVGDEAVHKELGGRMERAATTASSFEAEQDNATVGTSSNGEVELIATIDKQVSTIIEASLRRHLKLEDNGGVTTLPNSEIFEQLALIGVKKLEHIMKASKSRRRARVVESDDEEDLEDPSK